MALTEECSECGAEMEKESEKLVGQSTDQKGMGGRRRKYLFKCPECGNQTTRVP